MPPKRARQTLLHDLQRKVSCVTRSVVRADSATPIIEISFGGDPPRARAGSSSLWFEINLVISVAGDQQVAGGIVRYEYLLYGTAREGKPLLSYHLHPDPDGRGHQRPHLHVLASPRWAPRTLARTHLPTNRVAASDFIRFLIEELEVRPLRSDWDGVLRGTEVGV